MTRSLGGGCEQPSTDLASGLVVLFQKPTAELFLISVSHLAAF